ncbi:MAG: metallophosphoesterase [Sulfuricella denitrificans]|nr:metallophosphoesterase [Sulfuricella denitrificans]
MKTVSFALIGDIHYPEHKLATSSVDIKDKGISSGIVSRIAPNKLKKVSDEITRQLTKNNSIRAVLLCGDLTSKGNIEGYRECLQYLRSVLNLSNKEFWQDKHLHVVPGNHDISRHSITAGTDIFKKFEGIRQAWLDIDRTEMQPDRVRVSDIEDPEKSKTRIFSVNSCVGCGEQRYLPESIRSELQALLESYSASSGADTAFDLVGEQLDTPVIDEEHISDISESIRELQKLSDIPVLLAHHGLLPQIIPRLQIYSELLNCGTVRFALTSLGRSIIYCHGHVHADPVEIISQPQHGPGKIIIISAPLLIDGFNVINLIFSEDGVALGCEVVPIRLEHGCIVEKDAIRIPLLTQRHIMPTKSILRDAFDATNSTAQRFKQISESLSSQGSDERLISNALLELEWMGLVEIDNRGEIPIHWQIRRIAP